MITKNMKLILLMLILIGGEMVPIYKSHKKKSAMGEALNQYRIDSRSHYIKMSFLILLTIVVGLFTGASWQIDDIIFIVMFLSFWTLKVYNVSRTVTIFENGIYCNNRYFLWQELTASRERKKTVIIKTSNHFDSTMRVSYVIDQPQFLQEIQHNIA